MNGKIIPFPARVRSQWPAVKDLPEDHQEYLLEALAEIHAFARTGVFGPLPEALNVYLDQGAEYLEKIMKESA